MTRALPGSRLLCALALMAPMMACSSPPSSTPGLGVSRDRATFESVVLPVLIRDCGFHACHGSPERFFQVFGIGHGRLRPETRPLDATTPEEIEEAFVRALSMIRADAPRDSLLLRKPLSTAAGGAGHKGVDHHGRDVYQDRTDPDFVLIERWVAADGL